MIDFSLPLLVKNRSFEDMSIDFVAAKSDSSGLAGKSPGNLSSLCVLGARFF